MARALRGASRHVRASDTFRNLLIWPAQDTRSMVHRLFQVAKVSLLPGVSCPSRDWQRCISPPDPQTPMAARAPSSSDRPTDSEARVSGSTEARTVANHALVPY